MNWINFINFIKSEIEEYKDKIRFTEDTQIKVKKVINTKEYLSDFYEGNKS